jgi:hypothetical protein
MFSTVLHQRDDVMEIFDDTKWMGANSNFQRRPTSIKSRVSSRGGFPYANPVISQFYDEKNKFIYTHDFDSIPV